MKIAFAEIMNGWFKPAENEGRPSVLREAMIGGGKLSVAQISAVTLLIMLLGIGSTLAGANSGGPGVLVNVWTGYSSPLAAISITLMTVLALLCVGTLALLASSGALMAVASSLFISLITLYEIGTAFHGTALIYVVAMLLATVAINSVFMLLFRTSADDQFAVISGLISACMVGFYDVMNAQIVFDQSYELMRNVVRASILILPFVFAVMAAVVVGRWNSEQAKSGVGVVRAAIPAVVCVTFTAGFVLVIVLYNIARKVFVVTGLLDGR